MTETKVDPAKIDAMAEAICLTLDMYRESFHPDMMAAEVLIALEKVRHALTEACLDYQARTDKKNLN